MFRRLLGLSMLLGVLGFAVAQEPGKSDNDKPKPPPEKPKDGGPNPEVIVNSILQRMDKNKDGKINKSEAEGRIADGFERSDANKDGVLDRSELLAMARQLGRFGPPPGAGGRPPFGGNGPGGMRPDPLDFDALDKTADGRLTREELKGSRFVDVFDAIDANRDGKIDPKEWAVYHAKAKDK